jgi:hypothetical protein
MRQQGILMTSRREAEIRNYDIDDQLGWRTGLEIRDELLSEIDALRRFCLPEDKTDPFRDHVCCVICQECITCNLRPCRDGGAHHAMTVDRRFTRVGGTEKP